MRRAATAAALGAWLAVWASAPTLAHITFISPYTFNQDVRPILRERCGTCHGENGPGRPLLDFDRAKQNAVEIARSLMVGRMPPWSADAGAAAFKGDRSLTPHDLDVVMAWAAGGMPPGPAAPMPVPVVERAADSSMGAPDLELRMSTAFVFDASQSTAVHEEVFAAGRARGRSIRAVGVVPGDPSIVRRAEVAIRTPAGDRTIALWVPGDAPLPLEADAAYRVPRQASIVLRVNYVRQPGGTARPDRSGVDLYFSHGPRPPNPRDLVIEGTGVFRVNEPRVVSLPIARSVRALALRPIAGPVDAIVAIDIVSPGGQRQRFARLQLRANWPRRYIFAAPITLPAGSRVEARVSRRDPLVWSSLTGDEGIPAAEDPLRIALEIID